MKIKTVLIFYHSIRKLSSKYKQLRYANGIIAAPLCNTKWNKALNLCCILNRGLCTFDFGLRDRFWRPLPQYIVNLRDFGECSLYEHYLLFYVLLLNFHGIVLRLRHVHIYVPHGWLYFVDFIHQPTLKIKIFYSFLTVRSESSKNLWPNKSQKTNKAKRDQRNKNIMKHVTIVYLNDLFRTVCTKMYSIIDWKYFIYIFLFKKKCINIKGY